MDLATIIGLVLGFGAVIGGQILEGGHISALIQPTAFLIVAGGTVGATFVSFPMRDLIKALKDIKKIILPGEQDMEQVIKDLASYSEMARRNGLLALQPLINDSTGDAFKTKALQLVVDTISKYLPGNAAAMSSATFALLKVQTGAPPPPPPLLLLPPPSSPAVAPVAPGIAYVCYVVPLTVPRPARLRTCVPQASPLRSSSVSTSGSCCGSASSTRARWPTLWR